MSALTILHPPGYAPARGYSNGMAGTGRIVVTAGQIGWEPSGQFVHTDLVGQFGRALDHVLAVVAEAGGSAEHVASMTVFVTSVREYRESLAGIGRAWRQRMGRHFPAMAVVGVTELVESAAKVEIQATAIISEEPS